MHLPLQSVTDLVNITSEYLSLRSADELHSVWNSFKHTLAAIVLSCYGDLIWINNYQNKQKGKKSQVTQEHLWISSSSLCNPSLLRGTFAQSSEPQIKAKGKWHPYW